VANPVRTALLTATFLVVASAPALAGSNDITLQRFGQCTFGSEGNCTGVLVDEQGFRNFARDFGLVMSPRIAATAETLGQAGFAFQIDHTINTIDATEPYWILANENGDPSGSMATTSFHVRKGLPFSLELGGLFTALWNSSMVSVGTELKWALHEDYLWPVPDLMVRGFVNTVLGDPQLSLTNAGVDVVVGAPIGVGDVMNITPFAGYEMTAVISSSRLIDATPEDLTPPFQDLENPSRSNAPEFVFDVDTELVHQGLGGVRFQFTAVNLLMMVTASGDVQSYTFSLGADF